MSRGVALGLALCATSLHAEGARIDLDCQVTRSCDAVGACQGADAPIAFEIAPVSLDAQGQGEFRIARTDTSGTVSGPGVSRAVLQYDWTEPSGHLQRLMVLDTRHLLWVTLDMNETAPPRVRFLECEGIG